MARFQLFIEISITNNIVANTILVEPFEQLVQRSIAIQNFIAFLNIEYFHFLRFPVTSNLQEGRCNKIHKGNINNRRKVNKICM